MTRGYSLEQDLKLLVNNPKYSDIEILCENKIKLHGCRAILAARSEVFDRLLYNGMKESYEKQISLPNINSYGMEIILEYIYTGSIKEKTLTKDNIVEAFYAADYFQLPELQDFIMKSIEDSLKRNSTENYSPELLSKIAETMPLTEDNAFLNLLIEAVAILPLNTIELGRLSIAGLQYLLSYTYEKETLFATQEYEVFRYSAILAAKQVSNNAYKSLIGQLPTIEQIEQIKNSIIVENKFVTDHQKVIEELEPLIEFIDFRRIKIQILADIIEPLKMIPTEIITSAYRSRSNNLNNVRGIPCVWDELACGSNLIIEDNGRVVRASYNCERQNIRAKIILDKGIFEWDVIIEKDCDHACIGICASKNFNYNSWAGRQFTGWVLGSSGYCCNSNSGFYYCPSFGEGAIVTVHLNMNKRSCSFTVNGIKYPEVTEWTNLPSKIYPVVTLSYPGRFRIQPKL